VPLADAEGIARVAVPSPTLPPAETTNCWLLGTTSVVVVDPAGVTAATREGLFAALAGRRVAAIFLTHHHHDHIGGVRDLAARTGAPVLAHHHTASHVSFPVDVALEDGDRVPGDWTVLHTPGHARGHLCLRSPDGESIVAGDMVAGEGTIVLDPPEGELGRYLGSLRRLASLTPSRLLPAHGPAIEPAVPLLEHYIAHRHQRTVQVAAALAESGPCPPEALVGAVYPQLPTAFHPVAARQVRCHLEWLVEQGRASYRAPDFEITGAVA